MTQVSADLEFVAADTYTQAVMPVKRGASHIAKRILADVPAASALSLL
jgi:hypothetical protein